MTLKFLVSCTIFADALGFAPVVIAQTDAAKQEMQAANEAAVRAAQHSGVVHLADQATLKLPPGVDFVPQAEANRLMQAFGNASDDSRLGFFAPAIDSGKDWLIVVYFKKDGYITEDEARKWNPAEMLSRLRDTAEKQNAARRQRGIPEAEIAGWMQTPQYDRAHHRMKWAIDVRAKGNPNDASSPVNYASVALGREGYISLGLLTEQGKFQAQVPDLLKLANNLAFNKGKRYEDFNASTDKIADYGLASLIGGKASE